MEKHIFVKERLIAPTDFTSPRNIQGGLMPPSHFASTFQCTEAQGTSGTPSASQPPPPHMPWVNPAISKTPPGNPSIVNPWLAITQTQQDILELKKENERIMMLQGDGRRGRTSADNLSDVRTRSSGRGDQWSRWDSEWRLEAEKHKAGAERSKGQVDALNEIAERYREEIRDKDITLSRQRQELEMTNEELLKAKIELGRVREELSLSSAQKEEMSLQLEKLQIESGEEMTKLRRDVERSKELSRELALKFEMSRFQAEEEAKQQAVRLKKQIEELKKKQEVELQQLNVSRCGELGAARKENNDLQERLQSMTAEVLQLKSALMEVSTERDGLREHLSQMGQAFETQSATLHSLRNYIGQLAPEKGEKERLIEAVERLSKEKAALQTTTELLTVRLNSVNEILALLEEKVVKSTSADPLMKNGCEGLQVLHLWREKVFKLCVQLRSKDIEIRREKDKLFSEVRSTEQQLQLEQHRASVLQHSLHDRIAELDLERVENETLKQNLAEAHRGNTELRLHNQKGEADIKTLTEALQRFRQGFESRSAEVNAAQAKLNSCAQRLSFANRRVETIQGLVMRRIALKKLEQASKQVEQDNDSIRNLRIEHSLLCEERDKLVQELRRTPELVKKALSDLKDQYETKVRQQQQDLEHSCVEVRLAAAAKEQVEESLQEIQAQLEESNTSLERLRCELLRQQEQSERALLERVSEIEDRCAEKLREMEVQVNASRREHTKAVMTLREFQRETARRHEEMREIRRLDVDKTEHEVFNKQLKGMEQNNHPAPFRVAEKRLIEFTQHHTTAVQNSVPPRNQEKTPGVHLPAERLLSVLEELHTLSAAVVNSSEDSAEEDGQSDGGKWC
ncbi:coiled-coil alpha-helical rod protein 1 isoform X2 [Girardinichthys multiradiatus]|uniref:coiled-coil alpha-helical rod protein 1 isoform X2 n=1 Tax=Girardinichthys multiradiatus TaxID=208333 RepID=UPI001FAB6E9E|nr:coiled-coil alpha-helical rod protein 1 isoform X2 [Girardinichthys multiradiatus]